MTTRTCIECKKVLPKTFEFFYVRKNGKHQSWNSRCKPCVISVTSDYTKSRPKEVNSALAYERRHKKGYSTFEVEYDEGRWVGYGLTVVQEQKHKSKTRRAHNLVPFGACNSFEILFEGSREEVIQRAQDYIDIYGLETLLNKNKAYL